MPATGQDRRKSELAGSNGRKRELFREEDVRLQWASVRKAVSSLSPYLNCKPLWHTALIIV